MPLLSLAAVLTIIGSTFAATAEEVGYNTPVYDPVAKRYFAIVDGHNPQDIYRGINWIHAYAQAQTREFHGVRGRLAIVDSLEVHEFLMRTFRPKSETWVGLRYMCLAHKLETSAGRALAKNSFQAWDPNWNQDSYHCNQPEEAKPQDKFEPVAYTPVDKGFRWIVKGWGKEYFAYFIEFPTGQP